MKADVGYHVAAREIVCAEEPYSPRLIAEAAPLVDAHYHEIAWRKDKIPLDPDYEKYAAGAASGAIRIFTARQGGMLVGYAVFIVGPHLHYRQTVWAMNDVLYVTQGRRGYAAGTKLLRHAESALKATGAHVVGLHIKDKADFGPLAKRLGFERVESNWQKWTGD